MPQPAAVPARPDASPTDPRTRWLTVVPLWRMRRALDDVRALCVETSIGHALGVEYVGELISLFPHAYPDDLLYFARDLEQYLLDDGWHFVDDDEDR
jgi:hypothetical protein